MEEETLRGGDEHDADRTGPWEEVRDRSGSREQPSGRRDRKRRGDGDPVRDRNMGARGRDGNRMGDRLKERGAWGEVG